MISRKTVYSVGVGMATLGLIASSALVLAEDGNKNLEDARKVGSTLEVHITNNGKALVRGAKITSIGENMVTATTEWGSAMVTWTVLTDSNTRFIRKVGNSSVSEILIGDVISFSGMVSTNAPAFTIKADVLKNWSARKARENLNGTVKSVDALNLSFIVTTSRGDITVKTSITTQFKKGADAATFADVVVGKKVGAEGSYDEVTKTLTAENVRIQ
jgi:hypothetical protein